MKTPDCCWTLEQVPQTGCGISIFRDTQNSGFWTICWNKTSQAGKGEKYFHRSLHLKFLYEVLPWTQIATKAALIEPLPRAHRGLCHHGGWGRLICLGSRGPPASGGRGHCPKPSPFGKPIPSLSFVTLRWQWMLVLDFLTQCLSNTVLTLLWGQQPRAFHRTSGRGNCQEQKTFQANLVIHKAHHFPLSVFSFTGNLARTQLPSSGILWNVFTLAYQLIRYAADIQLVFLATSSQKVITMSTCSYFKGKHRFTAFLLSFV